MIETPTTPTIVEQTDRIYIAARFSRRHECNRLGHMLQERGAKITSRWIKPEVDHVLPTGISAQAADSERQRFALEDVEDVQAANWTISLMEEPRSNTRGGRHIEFGMAAALGHRLTIIGPRETVFHHLPQVEHFDTVDDFVASLPAAFARHRLNTRPQSEGVREREAINVTPGDAMLFADEAFRNMDDLADLSLNEIDDIVLALQSTFDRLSPATLEDK